MLRDELYSSGVSETFTQIIHQKIFFAFVRKLDKEELTSRNAYAILDAQTGINYKEKWATDVIINSALANPQTQMSPIENDIVDPKLKTKGAGQFLTIRAMTKLMKKYKVRSIQTEAINPISGATAKKFGAKIM